MDDMATSPSEQFNALLARGADQLFQDQDNKHPTGKGISPTKQIVADGDLDSFFMGCERGTVSFVRGARFNTLDRPLASDQGRWGLLSRGKKSCRYNAEYLPQIAAYVEAIEKFGYPSGRVFFEYLPHAARPCGPR